VNAIGIDVGTTGLKAVAVSPEGDILREKTVRYLTRLAGLGAEQDARAWWQAAIEALPEVVGGEDVCGVAVTAQAPTLVCVDANGEPLGTALTWIDCRAREESEELAEACEPTRNPPDPYFATAKLLWLVRNRPEEIERARAILCANSFTAQRLIGEFTFNETTAGLFQGWEGSFDPALSPLVPLELLAEPRPSMKIAGEVSPAGAAILAGMATGLWPDEKSAKPWSARREQGSSPILNCIWSMPSASSCIGSFRECCLRSRVHCNCQNE
jgi:xylulokinase